jgi:hypothetical protein
MGCMHMAECDFLGQRAPASAWEGWQRRLFFENERDFTLLCELA